MHIIWNQLPDWLRYPGWPYKLTALKSWKEGYGLAGGVISTGVCPLRQDWLCTIRTNSWAGFVTSWLDLNVAVSSLSHELQLFFLQILRNMLLIWKTPSRFLLSIPTLDSKIKVSSFSLFRGKLKKPNELTIRLADHSWQVIGLNYIIDNVFDTFIYKLSAVVKKTCVFTV